MSAARDWIVLTGQPVDTTKGGGFEFLGPYTEKEAHMVRDHMVSNTEPGACICLAIQLIGSRIPTRIMQQQRIKEDSTHH